MRGFEQIDTEIQSLEAQAAMLEERTRIIRASVESLRQEQSLAPQGAKFPFSDYEWESWQLNPSDRPSIPHALDFSGVYVWRGEGGKFMYVGESKSVAVRLRDHFALSPSPRVNTFIFTRTGQRVAPPALWVARVPDINDRLACEASAIEYGTPVFNVARAGIWRPE